MVPDVPELVVPELKLSCPLTPFVPALCVFKTSDPELVSLPVPLEIDTAPPVTGSECPALMMSWPPESLFDVPTDSDMLPLLPPVAAPVAITTSPLEPALVVPELNLTEPLTPAVPAFRVFSLMDPEDVAEPKPDAMEMKPPVEPDATPPDNTT
jgi:hypothetical protein